MKWLVETPKAEYLEWTVNGEKQYQPYVNGFVYFRDGQIALGPKGWYWFETHMGQMVIPDGCYPDVYDTPADAIRKGQELIRLNQIPYLSGRGDNIND